MDRYEYRLKTEQIQKLVAKKDYKTALQVVESMDWRKVRDVSVLSAAAEVYVAARRYGEAMDLLEQAYEYAPIGRRVIYRLTEVALLAKDAETARAYLDEFMEVAPQDSASLILEYRLAKLKEEPLERRIELLERYREKEMEDRWSYELAKLYAEAGRTQECVRICDEIALWFMQSKFTDKALLLKERYSELTKEQRDRLENPEQYRSKKNQKIESADEEPEPLVSSKEPGIEISVSEEIPSDTEEKKEDPIKLFEDISESEEGVSEQREPEIDVLEEEVEKPIRKEKSRKRRLPGLSWLFGGGDTEDEEEPSAEEEKPVPEGADAKEQEEAAEVTQETLTVDTEDDTEWITNMLEENLSEQMEQLEAEMTVQQEQLPEQEPEQETEGSEEAEEETEEAEETYEVNLQAEQIFDADSEQEKEEPLSWADSLAQLLKDPTVQSAAETGDVFSATIREADEPEQISEENEILEGQLEFDFLRLDAVAKAKEAREKELGIWDDPFRELVMQEPEEEAQIHMIFSSTEEELLGVRPVPEGAEEEWKAPEDRPAEETAVEEEAESEPEIVPAEPITEEAAAREPLLETAETYEESEKEPEEESVETAEESEQVSEESAEKPEEAPEELTEELTEGPAQELTAEEITEESVDENERALLEIEEEINRALAEDARDDTVSLGEREMLLEEKTEEPLQPIAPEEIGIREETEESEEYEEVEAFEDSEEETPVKSAADTWNENNMLVRTEDMKAGAELAMGYLLRLDPKSRPEAVAKTSGEKLNNKDWEELAERLKDRVLIVEHANAMDDACMEGLKSFLRREQNMAVLIDTEEEISRIGLRSKTLLDMFPVEYAYYDYTSDEIVQHGLAYAESRGWTLDDMATLAYYAAVENMPEVTPGRELIEAENIMDDAIEIGSQKSLGRFFKGAFGNKKEKGKVLRENCFKVR